MSDIAKAIPIDQLISIKKQVLADLNNDFRDQQKKDVDKYMHEMQAKQSALMEAIKNAFEKQVDESYDKYDKQDKQYVNLQNQVLQMDGVLKVADMNINDCMEQIQELRGGKRLKINGSPVLSTLQEHRSDIDDLYEFTETVKVKS